jgi:hypothetical protein
MAWHRQASSCLFRRRRRALARRRAPLVPRAAPCWWAPCPPPPCRPAAAESAQVQPGWGPARRAAVVPQPKLPGPAPGRSRRLAGRRAGRLARQRGAPHSGATAAAPARARVPASAPRWTAGPRSAPGCARDRGVQHEQIAFAPRTRRAAHIFILPGPRPRRLSGAGGPARSAPQAQRARRGDQRVGTECGRAVAAGIYGRRVQQAPRDVARGSLTLAAPARSQFETSALPSPPAAALHFCFPRGGDMSLPWRVPELVARSAGAGWTRRRH